MFQRSRLSLLARMTGAAALGGLLVAAPAGAATTQIVSDPMSRTLTSGLGSASVGGAYTVDRPEAFSVGSGVARIQLTKGQARSARLGPNILDTESTVTFSLSSVPGTGSGVYGALTSRRAADGSQYLVRVRVLPGGAAYLSAVRGTATAADVGQQVAAGSVKAGTTYRIKTQVTGTSAVTLRAKLWQVGTTEPGWTLTATDTAGARITSAGQSGMWWYVSGSGANTVATVDDFGVSSIGGDSGTAPVPPVTPPTSPTPPTGSSTAGASLPISYSLSSLSGTQYFVSPSGSDSAAGSQSAPLWTVAAGIAKISGSGTLVVRGGTYRESGLVIPSGKAIRIIAYPGETPTFLGSQAMGSGWTTEGSLSHHAYTPQPVTNASGISFTSGQALTGDGVGRYPDQAWLGSTALRQVSAKSSVSSGRFWVDRSNNRIYLTAADVAKGGVEASSFDRLMQIQGAGSVLEGLRITRYSNSADDYGVVNILGSGDRTELRHVEITDAAFQAMQLAGTDSTSGIVEGVVLRNVTLSRSNWMGLSSNMVENLKLTAVRLVDNNQFGEFADSPQSGGFKGSRNRAVVVRDSVVSGNTGHGLWFDQSSYDVVVANSTFTGNSASSVFCEISDRLLMVNNTVRTTGGRAVKLAGASGLRLVNNTIVGAADPLAIYVDTRSKPGCSDPSKPLCAGSYSSDRDYVRPRPATLDWMPRLDLMINNVIAYPTGSGYCGGTTTLCIMSANGSATAPLNTVIHQADSSRGIPKSVVNGNVYANGSGRVAVTGGTGYTTHSAFGSALAGSPVSLSGSEAAGKTGNSWVNADGSPTDALRARSSEAVAVPSDATINTYLPAGTKAYGRVG